MKKKFLSKVLALLVALAMLPTTAFAAAVTIWDNPDREGDGISYETIDAARDALESTYDSYALLGEDTTVDIERSESYDGIICGLIFGGNTFDLGGHNLTFNYKGIAEPDPDSEYDDIYMGLYVMGSNAVTNGTISINDTREGNTDSSTDLHLHAIHTEYSPESTYSDLNIVASGTLPMTSAIDISDWTEGGSLANIENVTVDVGGTAPVVSAANDSYERVTTNIVSGVFKGPLRDSNDEKVILTTPDKPYATEDGMTIYTSDKTAAVVKDADGKYHLYDDLAEASKVVGEGVTVKVVDKALKAPEGFEIKDGVLSKIEKPVGPVTPTEPVTPITPVLPEFPEVMSTPAESATTIADEETPLSGLTTLGELVSYLYTQEGSPDGEDAEGEYTLAMAWAVAKEIVPEDADPEEIVTGAILRDVMTAYAELLDTTFDVEIEVEDDVPVMNCDEILSAFFAAKTK